jgi:hypothetical protein
MTTVPAQKPLAKWGCAALGDGPRAVRALGHRLFPVHWLRPSGNNVHKMLAILRRAQAEGRDYVEFMLHSSELMPGGSHRFRTDADIDALYRDMEQVFDATRSAFEGRTLKEYYARFRASRPEERRGTAPSWSSHWTGPTARRVRRLVSP